MFLRKTENKQVRLELNLRLDHLQKTHTVQCLPSDCIQIGKRVEYRFIANDCIRKAIVTISSYTLEQLSFPEKGLEKWKTCQSDLTYPLHRSLPFYKLVLLN